MSLSFSQRHGFKPANKVIQLNTLDQETRNCIWNVLYPYFTSFQLDEFEYLWGNYFKQPQGQYPIVPGCRGEYNSFFEYFYNYVISRSEWNELFDFIEFLSSHLGHNIDVEINSVFEHESVGYRLINGLITPITNETELKEIDDAIADPNGPVNKHLQNALAMLSDRKSPNYPNSVKESISAVESMCCIICGKKATLGDALKIIDKEGKLHSALKDAMDKLYGYTCDAGGIRHGKIDYTDVNFELAKFILVTCSAFINYVKTLK